MKTVTPNITDVLTTKFVAQQRAIRRFRRYWGTETVNGVEVLKGRQYFYPELSEDVKKLGKHLKILKDMEARQKGIRSSWLYLNPDKADDSITYWDKDILANNLNIAMNTLRRGSIVISSKLVRDMFVSPPITDPSGNLTDEEKLAHYITQIEADYSHYWSQDFPIFSNRDDPFQAIILSYLLRSSDVPYTITAVEKTVSNYTKPVRAGIDPKIISTNGPAWRLLISVDSFEFTRTTDIVNMIINDINQNKTITDKIIYNLFDSAGSAYRVEDGDPVDTDYVYETQPSTRSPHWYTYKGVPYLRVSFFDDPSRTKEEKVKYLYSCIDNGYRKKKSSILETVVAFIVIAVITYFSWGTGAKLAIGSATASAVVSVAISLSLAAMYINLAMVALTLLGAPNIAGAMGRMMQTVNPLVRIANIISLFAAIYSVVREGAKKATEKAVKEGAEEVAKASLKETLIEIAKVTTEQLTGLTAASNMQLEHIIKMTEITFGLYQKNELRSIAKELESYRTELAKLRELEEANQTTDIAKDMVASYPNLLAKDQSIYADRYDRPYEWWSTPYHTGNIQATTVSALWLSDI